MSVSLDVNQSNSQKQRTTLAKWLYSAIAEPGVRLRVRLRGNNLHILCESQSSLKQTIIVSRLTKALSSHLGIVKRFTTAPEHPIYKIILYSKTTGQKRPDWIEPIVLDQLIPNLASTQTETVFFELESSNSRTITSLKALAQTGKRDAIARYLSESFSHLGVSVKVYSRKSPKNSQQRLLVYCYCNYSPDLSLLAEPLNEHLRELQLKEFQDAVICGKVTGEDTPEWVLKVNLTHSDEMLREWARWGDLEAIARYLDTVTPEEISLRMVLQDSSLHLFSSLGNPSDVPNQQEMVAILTEELEKIAPQGIESATVYGVKVSKSNTEDPETVVWLQRLDLPASTQKALTPSTVSLAKDGDLEALTFLLHRTVNPSLDEWLATGGIYLQLSQEEDLLHVMSESVTCPSQGQVVQPVENLLREFLLSGLAGVRIYGKRAGQANPAWSYGVDFVSRKTHTSPPPEFAETEDISALVHIESEEKEEVEIPRKEKATTVILQNLGRTVANLLCKTRLFFPANQTQSFSPSPTWDASHFSPYQGLKVALVWSILGGLLAVQSDWLIGRLLNTDVAADRGFFITPSEASPETLELPQISLQKTTNEEDGFNATGFTTPNATSAVALATARSSNPTFNNPILDDKLALYQERIAQKGVPDVLILGSSRAMRGVNPQVLEIALQNAGYENLDIYNFGVNGATAQVVDLILRQLLTPEQLPKLIIWADGARAFNSGREDLTFDAIASSPGYEKLQAGLFPPGQKNTSTSQPSSPSSLNPETVNEWLNNSLEKLSSTYSQRQDLKNHLRDQFTRLFPAPVTPQRMNVEEDVTLLAGEMDMNGFLPISKRFDIESYYQEHPKVAGAYDGDYATFDLTGKQDEAFNNVLAYLNSQDIPLVFVNTPLTDNYLDEVRSYHEQEFQDYMRSKAAEGLIFRDLSSLWTGKHGYFSDPSHLNRFGAYQVSLQLAQDPMIPWTVNP